MVFAVILAIVAAIFFASTNHIDKFLISKMLKRSSYRALIMFSTVVAGGIMALIYAFICNFALAFDWLGILMLLIGSILQVVSLVFYFKALARNDTTIVAILFQLIPVFILFVSPIFLPEQDISLVQLIGGIITTFAAIAVTYEPNKKKFGKHKMVTLLLMTVSSVASALWFILERRVNLDHDFNQTILWSNITLWVVGVIMLVTMKSYRKSFGVLFKNNGVKVIGLNVLNELIGSIAEVLSTFAGTLAPVTLVSFVSQGVQPFAVISIGVLLTKFFPKVGKENVSKKNMARRVVTIVLCLIGLACIEFG